MLKEIKEVFGHDDLWEIIGWNRKDPFDSVKMKMVYRQKAVLYHPYYADHGNEDDVKLRTKQFELLKEIHSLMQDGHRRRCYFRKGIWMNAKTPNEEADPLHLYLYLPLQLPLPPVCWNCGGVHGVFDCREPLRSRFEVADQPPPIPRRVGAYAGSAENYLQQLSRQTNWDSALTDLTKIQYQFIVSYELYGTACWGCGSPFHGVNACDDRHDHEAEVKYIRRKMKTFVEKYR